MKIKRFFAPDIRQAIRMVREEQGADAVILSNRRVDGGVEIVSATDYDEALFNEYRSQADKDSREPAPPHHAEAENVLDVSTSDSDRRPSFGNRKEQRSVGTAPHESETPARQGLRPEEAVRHAEAPHRTMDMQWSQDPQIVELREEIKTLRGYVEHHMSGLAWSDYAQRSPVQAGVLRRLMAFGLGAELARVLVTEIGGSSDIESGWSAALEALVRRIPVTSDDILDRGGVLALVGPTGVGKTTTIAKLAARYALRRGVRHVALVTTDNYRVGAHEQLRTYGRLLDIPVRVAANHDELRGVLDDLIDKDLVLIDTAGMSQRDIRLSEQFAVLRGAKQANTRDRKRVTTYLALSATTHACGMDEVVQAFKGAELDGCILTKTDEAAQLGAALEVTIKEQLPLVYVSNGQRVPEDLHRARAEDLVAHGLGLMKDHGKEPEEEMLAYTFGRTAAHAH